MTERIVAEEKNEPKKLSNILTTLLEVFIVLISNTIFRVFFSVAIDPLKDEPFYAIILYIGITLITICSIFLGNLISVNLFGAIPLLNNKIHTQEGLELNKSTKIEKTQKESVFKLIMIGLLIYLFVYFPLDFLLNLIPGLLNYSAESIVNNSGGYIYSEEINLFILSIIIVHICVGLREEMYFRYYLGRTLQNQANKKVGVYVTSFVFGLAHFYYIILKPDNILFPIIWGLSGLYISFIVIAVFYKYRSILPVVIGHSLNNISSSVSVRMHLLDYGFDKIFLNLYLPQIIIAMIILIVLFKPIRAETKKILGELKENIKDIPGESKLLMVIFIPLISLSTLLLL